MVNTVNLVMFLKAPAFQSLCLSSHLPFKVPVV